MRQHRQRFVAATNNIKEPVKILQKVDNVWIEGLMSPDAAQELFDVKFAGMGYGTGEAEELQKEAFDFGGREDQRELEMEILD